jgi:hypothetical protein
MAFLGNIAFSTTIVTLFLGFALLGFSKKEGGATCLKCLKCGAYMIIILSVLNALCVGTHMLRDWKNGAFDNPNEMMSGRPGGMDMKQHQKMMQNMMMKKNMMGNKPPMQNPDDVPPDQE